MQITSFVRNFFASDSLQRSDLRDPAVVAGAQSVL
jgi:hypothetical protein